MSECYSAAGQEWVELFGALRVPASQAPMVSFIGEKNECNQNRGNRADQN
jgi:hypothetical protein